MDTILALILLVVALLLAIPLFAISARVTRRENAQASRAEAAAVEEIERGDHDAGAQR